ncbi:MAG: D-amino-acid transaminase [Hyphomonadaceae bacterium]
MRVAYVNGAYLPLSRAGVSVEDRGFQFADAVYEVWAVRNGALMDEAGHFTRLRRSLSELRIAEPMDEAPLRVILHETQRRNRVANGLVYLQISRGAAPREHAFPTPAVRPSVIVTAKTIDPKKLAARAAAGVKIVSAPDNRWGRCDIKPVGLLPNVLAKQSALDEAAFDAWLIDAEGRVTEGTASNAWIVDREGRLRTAPLSANILHGVTRASLMRLAAERQIPVLEESFTLHEAYEAREAFMSSASNACTPIVEINGRRIGDGRPGPIAVLLRDAYFGSAGA